MPENPILRRELTAALRARRTLVLAALYLIGLAAIVGVLWPREGVYSLAAQSSRSVLLVFTITQLLLVMLYAPAFGATAITLEKEQNSYELLFTTQLRPHAIIIGKLVSSILCLLLFVLLSFPIFAACFFLGAVSLPEALALYAITLLTAVFFALLGLAVSAVKNSSYTALVTTYLLLLFINTVPWIPYLILQNRPAAAQWTRLVRAGSPIAAVVAVIVPTFDGTRASGAPAQWSSWKIYLLVIGAGSLALIAFLLTAVYRSASRPARRHVPVLDDPRALAKRKLRFPFYLIDPIRRRGHIPGWLNPVFAREMRAQAFGGGIWIFRSAYLCLAVSILLMAMVAGNFAMQSPDVIRSVALILQLGLIVLVVPSLTVGAITQEREQGHLDLLRQTRIGPFAFLLGKIMVAAVFVLFIVVGSVPLWFAIYYMHTNTLQQIYIAWSVIGSTVLLAMMAGLFSSAVASSTATAAGLAYGILSLICVATLFPVLAAGRLAASVRDSLLMLNPFCSAIQALTTEFFGESRELWRSHLHFAAALSALFLVIAALRVRQLLRPEK